MYIYTYTLYVYVRACVHTYIIYIIYIYLYMHTYLCLLEHLVLWHHETMVTVTWAAAGGFAPLLSLLKVMFISTYESRGYDGPHLNIKRVMVMPPEHPVGCVCVCMSTLWSMYVHTWASSGVCLCPPELNEGCFGAYLSILRSVFVSTWASWRVYLCLPEHPEGCICAYLSILRGMFVPSTAGERGEDVSTERVVGTTPEWLFLPGRHVASLTALLQYSQHYCSTNSTTAVLTALLQYSQHYYCSTHSTTAVLTALLQYSQHYYCSTHSTTAVLTAHSQITLIQPRSVEHYTQSLLCPLTLWWTLVPPHSINPLGQCSVHSLSD